MKKKTRKFAIIFISVVLALLLAFGAAACTTNNYYITYPEEEKDGETDENVDDSFTYPGDDYTLPEIGEDGSDSGTDASGSESDTRPIHKYVNMAYESGTEINAAIGYNSSDTGMFFSTKAVASNTTIVGGYTMNAFTAKPTTQAIMNALDITIKDRYSGSSTSRNLTELVDTKSWGSTVDMATTDLSVAASVAAEDESVLNLANYLQYMPNFQKFLSDNPVVYLSLLQGGMDTTTGEDQALYIAPYFDGMDDIEKGVLMRHDWIESVLDEEWKTPGTDVASNDTFYDVCYSESGVNASTAGTKTYATSYMGTTGSWTIVSTAEDYENIENDGSETFTIKKDYDAALAAFKNSQENDQTKAYAAVAGEGKTYMGMSGNIVDIMNSAIEEDLAGDKTGASGENLANLYKAYIDAAYTADTDGDGQYTTYYGDNAVAYSKVFTGYSGCWDVDDLTALLRIIKCSSGQVGLNAGYKTVGIFPRTYDNGRTPDLVSLVGELYGCRGATSRYEQTYIDSNGVLQDTRNDEKFWDSLVAFGGLCSEGLVDGGYIANGIYNMTPNTYINDLHGANGTSNTLKEEGFMQWDYSQTQTTVEFTDNTIEYGWVNTPVSLWDDGTYDGTGVKSANGYEYSYKEETGEKYMRFTDSWRSTKTAGLAVAADVAKDENKLAACLAFVDYLYSADGQITTTYGMQSTNGNTNPNGTWYGNPVSGSYEITDVCDVTTQWIVREEYRDEYVVNGGKICTKDGNVALDENGEELALAVYAENESYARYSMKKEYRGLYFVYDGVLYTGTLYKGEMTPTITDELYEHFIDAESPENKAYSATWAFTNFARMVLGSTLPICVKDQSFENQLTAQYAKDCATVVSVSIGNGTINHCELDVTDWNYFYTCAPTGLPLDTDEQIELGDSSQNQLKYLSGTAYGSSDFYSLFIHVIWYGYTGTYSQNQCYVDFGSIGSASDMIQYFNGYGLETRIGLLQTGWETCLEYWAYLK